VTIRFVVAGPIDQRTGGYLYDARIVSGLRRLGRDVEVLEVAGRWPAGDATGRADLAHRLRELPDGALVVVDGLVGGAVPDVLEGEAGRLRLVPLVHHPLCDEGGGGTREAEHLEALEARTLRLGRGVIVTSEFTRGRVMRMGVDPARVRVVEPGTAPVAAAGAGMASRVGHDGVPTAEADMGAPVLLCVGSVVPRKGQLTLVAALRTLEDLEWRCVLVGSTERDPEYARGVAAAIDASPVAARIDLRGEIDDQALERAWGEADLFVLPSRYEGYGMAFTEALSRGLPVVGTTGGAIPFTVPPEVGELVHPGDVDGLARVLRAILTDPARHDAMARRSRAHAAALPDWATQTARFADALDDLTSVDDPTSVDDMRAADEPSAAVPRHDEVVRETPAPDPHDHFSSDWLALREPADHAARSETLVARLGEVAAFRNWSTVLDLGTGRGSNLRWLAPRLPGVDRWVALDHDAALLAEIETAWEGSRATPGAALRTVEGDLAREGLAEIGAGADIVTASALLDLVSAEWVGRLARACADRGAAALLALSWDGTAELSPADPTATEILEAVREHQRGEKGMGVALGPSAPAVTADAFRAVGMEVVTEPTPWRLAGAGQGALMLALVDGWVDAACEIAPSRAKAFREWIAARRPRLLAGEVEIRVGHVDLLALPRASA
jgi:glycosyltransferase involved in cell wall biosynthesis